MQRGGAIDYLLCLNMYVTSILHDVRISKAGAESGGSVSKREWFQESHRLAYKSNSIFLTSAKRERESESFGTNYRNQKWEAKGLEEV